MNVKQRFQNVSTSQWNNILMIVLIGLVLFMLFGPSSRGAIALEEMRAELKSIEKENKVIQALLSEIKLSKQLTDTTLATELEKHGNTIRSLELRLRRIQSQSSLLARAIADRLEQLNQAPGPEILPAITDLNVVGPEPE